MGEGTRSLEEAFGRGLRRFREQQGLKQETLARLAGYANHSNVAKIENGSSLPSFGKALALARVLNVPVEAFIVEGGQELAEHMQWVHALQLTVLGLSDEIRVAMANFLEELSRELRVHYTN
jgi:transcriptional regulator with XRE-family HTH domain